MFEIIYSEKSLKYLEKIDKKKAIIIFHKIESIKENPLHYIERLASLDLWKLRIGDYRAIIRLDRAKNELSVIDIGHRREVYKKL